MSAGVLIFMVSINHVSQLNLYGDDSPISYVEQTASNLESIVDSKNTRAIFSSLYIQDGRLFSTENNANWRLEIWQDVTYNLFESEQFYLGYGYSDKIPEMELPHRQGTDGSNENVHNFIVNVFARGGLFGLIPYLSFFLYLLIRSVRESGNYLIVLYVCSVFAISFFGATNESVRYPFIFYTFLGYYFNNLDKTYKYKLLK
jgi:O-antigen ligase